MIDASLGSMGHDVRHADRHAAHPNGSVNIFPSAQTPWTCLALKGGNMQSDLKSLESTLAIVIKVSDMLFYFEVFILDKSMLMYRRHV